MLSSVFDWEKKFNVLMSGNDSKSLKKAFHIFGNLTKHKGSLSIWKHLEIKKMLRAFLKWPPPNEPHLCLWIWKKPHWLYLINHWEDVVKDLRKAINIVKCNNNNKTDFKLTSPLRNSAAYQRKPLKNTN